MLVLVALTSFFLRHLLDALLTWFSSFTPPDVLQIVRARMNATIDTSNRAYGIEETRPWWKVQALAIVLTVVMSVFVLVAFTLVVAGPEIAEKFAARDGGPLF